MSYESSLEAAGATVHCFEYFGSYQGDWYAKVTYQGKTGWTRGCFGSCSYCDAYESEFGWSDPDPEQLAQFGMYYLECLYTQEEAEAKASEHLEWDLDANKVLAFIRNNG